MTEQHVLLMLYLACHVSVSGCWHVQWTRSFSRMLRRDRREGPTPAPTPAPTEGKRDKSGSDAYDVMMAYVIFRMKMTMMGVDYGAVRIVPRQNTYGPEMLTNSRRYEYFPCLVNLPFWALVLPGKAPDARRRCLWRNRRPFYVAWLHSREVLNRKFVCRSPIFLLPTLHRLVPSFLVSFLRTTNSTWSGLLASLPGLLSRFSHAHCVSTDAVADACSHARFERGSAYSCMSTCPMVVNWGCLSTRGRRTSHAFRTALDIRMRMARVELIGSPHRQ